MSRLEAHDLWSESPPPKGAVLHAEGQQEHSLCGMAFDAFSSGHADEEVFFAKLGEIVTCPQCREHIDFVRKFYRRYRYVLPKKEAK